MNDLVRFQLRGEYRASEMLGVVLYSFMFLLVGVVAWAIALGAANAAMPAQQALARLLSYVPIALTIWFWWRVIRSRLQWTIFVEGEDLRIGAWPFADRIRLDQVDLIRLRPYDGRADAVDWVEVQCGAYRRRIELGPDATGFSLLLREKCRRALFIDQNGNEHAPAWNEDVVATLDVAARHHRRMVWQSVLATIGWGAAAIVASYVITARPNANKATVVWFSVIALGGVMGFLVGLPRTSAAWRHWRYLCRRRIAERAQA